MDDREALAAQNRRFIEACCQGSWPMLKPILSPTFSYLDGATGEVWDMDRYIDDLQSNPDDTLVFDQLVIRVAGETAAVSARSRSNTDTNNRYLDTYEGSADSWLRVHACVWPLPAA